MENKDFKFVNERRAAELLGVSRFSLQGWRFRGKGPPYHIVGSRRILYKVDDLREYIEAGRVEPRQ